MADPPMSLCPILVRVSTLGIHLLLIIASLAFFSPCARQCVRPCLVLCPLRYFGFDCCVSFLSTSALPSQQSDSLSSSLREGNVLLETLGPPQVTPRSLEDFFLPT